MQFENFTDRARRIVHIAVAEAERLDDRSADTVHLLLGMIREGHGVASIVLVRHDVDADKVIGGCDSVRDDADVTFDSVELRSRQESEWLGHFYPGTEHLLLGVCCLTNSRAARLLKQLGKQPLDFCQSVLDILGHHEQWERWLAEHPDVAKGR